ncbi:hypothetical protein GQ457_02G027920 [Hibiscus cannabinus]
MTKAPFSGKGERASDLLGLIHSDVCGPMNTQARGGFQYFITFTDDFSRYGYIYLMNHKSEALEKFKEFKNEVQNQHGKSIKALRSDRGGEYLSQDFDELLKECGIVSQLTPPGKAQWNGVSERRNRTLLDMVRFMMSHTDLPTSFWGYALETTAFPVNHVPSKSVQKTPHEMWTGKRPIMSFMRVWGCQAYVKHQMSTMLEPKSQKCTFVGYPKETKGYYFYNENKVFVARTRVFLEKEFLTNKGKGRNIKLKEVQQQQVHEPEVEETPQIVEENSTDLETQPLRRSTRERHEPERYGFLVTTLGDVILVDQDEPKTYQEEVASSDSKKWLEAMRSEMDSMSENQVWTLVEPPEGIKPIGCKWVFKNKTDMDGNVQTYKGRLVAKGFRQIHGVDYDETFSLVAMFKSIRILLAVAAFHDYEIWEMDVKTAFLNGKLEEDAMKEMFDQLVSNLKQDRPVAQVVAAASRAPIEKLSQHRGYMFAGTIKDKPKEAEYWLERTTQIVTKQIALSDEHKLECAIALLADEALKYIKIEKEKCRKFTDGLNDELEHMFTAMEIENFQILLNRVIATEAKLKAAEQRKNGHRSDKKAKQDDITSWLSKKAKHHHENSSSYTPASRSKFTPKPQSVN